MFNSALCVCRCMVWWCVCVCIKCDSCLDENIRYLVDRIVGAGHMSSAC